MDSTRGNDDPDDEIVVSEKEPLWTNNNLHLSFEKPQLKDLSISSLQDVESFLSQIQQRQEAEHGLINLNRLTPFVEAMKAIESLSVPDLDVAPVWNSMKYMLEHVRQDRRAFDQLLEAYQHIGKAMPDPEQIKRLSVSQYDLKPIVDRVYEEVLRFHSVAASFFDQPAWKTLLRPLWKDFAPLLTAIESNLNKITAHLNNIMMAVPSDTHPSHLHHSGLQPTIVNFQQHYHHQYIAGNSYEKIEVSGNARAQIGDSELGEQKWNELIALLKQSRAESDQEEVIRRTRQITSVTKWLAAATAEEFQRQAFSELRHKGTGTWILSQWKIRDWMNDEFPRWPVLWLRGIPGAGKTVLASVIIYSCMQIADSDTIYFYSKHDGIDNTGTPMSVLRGLLKQLLYCRPHLAPFFDEARRTSGEQPELRTFNRAKKILDPTIRGTRRLYIVLDGIDECGTDDGGIKDRNELLSFLTTLVDEVEKDHPGKLRLLVVSQNEPDIRKALSTAQEVELQAKDNQHDIEAFVIDKCAQIQQKFELTEERKQNIVTRICRQAHGQFLYARLVVQNLHDQVNDEALYHELKDFGIPEDLSSAYERVICRIRKQNTEKEWQAARQLLGWMCRAFRPLKRYELQGALSIDKVNNVVNPSLRLRTSLEKLCGVLISVVNKGITLIHSTARRFITESEHVDAFLVDCELTGLCLRYLTFSCFHLKMIQQEVKTEYSQEIEQKQTDVQKQYIEQQLESCVLRGDFAFADYAITKWAQHVRQLIKHIDELPQNDFEAMLNLAKWPETQPSGLAQERVRELTVVCELVGDFVGDHTEFSMAATQATDFKFETRTLQLLSELEAIEHYRAIIMHDDLHKQRSFTLKAAPSLSNLELSLLSWRQCLEKLGGRKGKKQEVERLKELYGQKLFRCSRITCRYFYEGHLTLGIRNHHHTRHERPFQCGVEDCPSFGWGFASQTQLDRHVAVCHPDDETKRKQFDATDKKAETAEIPNMKFHCAICDKYFTRAAALRSHQLVHAGQKPYECANCGRSFTRKNDCTRHEKLVHNKGR